MDTLNVLITSLITSGGLGFINFFILAKLGKVNIYEANKSDKYLILIFFSIINYVLYTIIAAIVKSALFLLNYYFNDKLINFEFLILPISLIITCALTITFSFKLLPKTFDKIVKVLNDQRKTDGKSGSFSETTNDAFFSKYENNMMFVYDFDNNLIFSGYGYRWSSSTDKTTEFAGIIFNEEFEHEKYDDLLNFIRENGYQSDVLINVDKKIKFVVIS